jgi:Protein of unknown function (DUF1569)
MSVDTAKSTEYRKLRFESIDDLLKELDAIDAAAYAGRLQTTGNWTAGQILSHLAAWIEYGYIGFPIAAPPWIFRMILKMLSKRYLKSGFPRGVRIPGTTNGTTGQDDAPYDEASQRYRTAFLRLKNGEQCKFDSPAFGAMSHEDRIRLNLRHAELHLGYLKY